jgi:HD-like signal output (HDOD) protein
MRGFLFVLIVVALVAVVLSLLRRVPRSRADSETPRLQPAPPKLELPAPPPPTQALERAEIAAKLHELVFGPAIAAGASAEHAKALAAVGAVLETAVTEPRYAPRRPMLLPQLLRAASDAETSRRELAAMIARDPALVGSLLKLANSPAYRRSAEPIESVERAVTVLGTQGVRSLAAAALVQPVFRTNGDGAGARFAEVTWDHSQRAAAAAEVYALEVENADPFTAQLLALVTGLGAIVVFRVLADEYARSASIAPDSAAVAAALDEYTAWAAHRIAESWELSDQLLEALAEQLPGSGTPASALGRSLRFATTAGALSVLRVRGAIDDATGRASLIAAGGIGSKFERLWERLTAAER